MIEIYSLTLLFVAAYFIFNTLADCSVSKLKGKIMFKYQTSVKVTLPNFVTGKATIEWCVEIENRQWGLKGIVVYCPDQTVELKVEDDEIFIDPIVLDLKEVETSVDGLTFDSSLFPVELDIYKKSNGKIKNVLRF